MDKQAENFNSSGQNDFEELNNNLIRLVDVCLMVIHSISPNQNDKTEDSIPEYIREIMRMMLSILDKCVDLCKQSEDLKPIYFEIKYLKSLLHPLCVVENEFNEMQNKLKRRKEIAKYQLSKSEKLFKELFKELKELKKFENLAYEVLEQEQKDRIYSIYKNYSSISHNVNLHKKKVGANDDAESIANEQLKMMASYRIVKKEIITNFTESGQDVQICEKKIDENDENNFKESINKQLELIEGQQTQIKQLLSDKVNNDKLNVTGDIGKLYRDYEDKIIEVTKQIMRFYVEKNYSNQNEKEQWRMRAVLVVYDKEPTYIFRTSINLSIKIEDNKKKYEKMKMEEDNVKRMEQYINAFDKKIDTIQIFYKIISDKIDVLIQVVKGKNSKTGNICQNKEKEMEQRNQIQNENKGINNKIKKINNKSDREKIKFLNDNSRTQDEDNLNNKKVYNNYKADNLNKNELDNKKGMEKVNNDEKIEQGEEDEIKTNAPYNNNIFKQSNSNNNDTQNKTYEVNNSFENELKDKKEIEETDAKLNNKIEIGAAYVNNNIYNKNKLNSEGKIKIDDNRSEDSYKDEYGVFEPEQNENQGLDNKIQPIINDGNDNKMRNWGIGIFVLGGTGTILVLVVPSVKIVFIAVPLLFALIGIILLGIHLCRKNNQPPIDIAAANGNDNLNNSISIDNLKNNLKDDLIKNEDKEPSVPGNEKHI